MFHDPTVSLASQCQLYDCFLPLRDQITSALTDGVEVTWVGGEGIQKNSHLL